MALDFRDFTECLQTNEGMAPNSATMTACLNVLSKSLFAIIVFRRYSLTLKSLGSVVK
jgi:hypothetical protein